MNIDAELTPLIPNQLEIKYFKAELCYKNDCLLFNANHLALNRLL